MDSLGHFRRRRAFLAKSAGGFGSLAFSAMAGRDLRADAGPEWLPPDGHPHFAPKADSVIWVFLNGGMSHLETFDPNPELAKHAGTTSAASPSKDVQDPKKLA
ncbi:MAG: DUF1501 domain-containing protein, partial [Gemmataceae bacterium]